MQMTTRRMLFMLGCMFLAATCEVRSVSGRPLYKKVFDRVYPLKGGLTTCAICHPQSIKSELNSYGTDLKKELGESNVRDERRIADALRAIGKPERFPESSVQALVFFIDIAVDSNWDGVFGVPARSQESDKPHVTKPDVTKPDVTKPDVAKPDVAKPDVAKPDVAKPDVTKPDVAKPDVTKPDGSGEPLPIYITPIYDSRGPIIEVGRFSQELRKANSKSIVDVAARMKKEWGTLSVEQMYVVAIRLFDLGHRDEAVYWFYSAQYRARLFVVLTFGDEEDLNFPADQKVPAILINYIPTHQSFFVLAGGYINPYAFRRPAMLKQTIQTVARENETLPKLREIYPLVTFVQQDRWKAWNQKLADGLKKLEVIVSELKLKPNGEIFTQEELEQAFRQQSPLTVAFDAGDKAQFEKLLKDGADPNFRPRVGTALLHDAAMSADSDWLRLLLKHGADPDLVSIGHPYAPDLTPLFFAINLARHANVVQLIKAGADVNYSSRRKATPLTAAEREQTWHTYLVLLEAGADPRPPESSPSLTAPEDRHFRKRYAEPITDVDRRRRASDNKEQGVDFTIEQEKEQYYAVRAWLVRKGHLEDVSADEKPLR